MLVYRTDLEQNGYSSSSRERRCSWSSAGRRFSNYIWVMENLIALLFGFKHRISEVFTSGDVSLHNIVIFLSYKLFETCQILLWTTKDDIRFLKWNFKCLHVWRWGWYFQIVFNKYQHRTFPKHNYERVFTLSVMILDNSQREIISQ